MCRSLEALPSVMQTSASRALLTLRRQFAAVPAQAQAASEVGALPPFNFQPPPYTGPSKDEVLRLRQTYLSPGARTVLVACDSSERLQACTCCDQIPACRTPMRC